MDLPATHNHPPIDHTLLGNRSEQKLKSLFMQAPAAIAFLEGPEHIYTFVNPLYQKLFNRSEAQLLGKTVKQVFPEVERQGVYDLFDTVFTTGEPIATEEFEVTFVASGEQKPAITISLSNR